MTDNPYDREFPEDIADLIGDLSMHDSSERGSNKSKHYTPQFVDTKSAKLDLESIVSTMDSRQETYVQSELSQRSAEIDMTLKHPFSVVFLADVHLGSVYTDHNQFFADMDKVIATPNMYVMFLHNLVDNAIPSKYPHNMLVNSIPPGEQFPLMQAWLKKLDKHNKVLAVVEADCHEGWSWSETGQSAAQLLYGYEGRQYPVLTNGGIVTLKTPGYEYKIGLWHKQGPFNSYFNKSHSLQQIQRLEHRGQVDVVAAGHNHVSEAMMTYYGTDENMKAVAYIRCGTYKGTGRLKDRWIVDRRGISGEPAGQTVLFWPDHRELEVSLGLDQAIRKHLALYVGDYLKSCGAWDKLVERVK